METVLQSYRTELAIRRMLNGAPPGKIGIFRALHVGDILCAIPAVRAIKQA